MTTSRDADVAIIGAGLAGLTAGLFAARAGLRTVIYDRMGPGGQLLNVHRVENFPGFPDGVHGFDLAPGAARQAEAAGARFEFAEVEKITPRPDGDWSLHADRLGTTAAAVIVASGSTLAQLGLDGEERLHGRGVSYCAVCDGEFFRDQDVAVVGGGDSALDETLYLAEIVRSIALVSRDFELTATQATVDRVAALENVRSLTGRVVEALHGVDELSAIDVRSLDGGGTQQLQVSGLFVYVGFRPNTDLLNELVQLDEGGQVETDLDMWTGVPGLYAAGDIRQRSPRVLVTNAGDGATAALAVERYIRSHR